MSVQMLITQRMIDEANRTELMPPYVTGDAVERYANPLARNILACMDSHAGDTEMAYERGTGRVIPQPPAVTELERNPIRGTPHQAFEAKPLTPIGDDRIDKLSECYSVLKLNIMMERKCRKELEARVDKQINGLVSFVEKLEIWVENIDRHLQPIELSAGRNHMKKVDVLNLKPVSRPLPRAYTNDELIEWNKQDNTPPTERSERGAQ